MKKVRVDTSWRRMAGAIFERPTDGKISGIYDIDMTNMMKAMDEWSKDGHRITPTHMMMSTLGHILETHAPELNAYMRLGKVYQRSYINVSASVLVDGKTLTSVCIADAHEKSILTLADEVHEKVDKVRGKRDSGKKQARNPLVRVPWPLRKWIYQSIRWMVHESGLPVPNVGLSQDMFGSVLVSNIGSLGIDYGIPALMPASNLSFVMAVGKIKEKPVVKNGEICIAPVLPIAATFDHRVVDGGHIAKMVKGLDFYFQNPEELCKPASQVQLPK